MYDIIKEVGKVYLAKRKFFGTMEGYVLSLGNIGLCIGNFEEGYEIIKIECQTSAIFPALMGNVKIYVTANEDDKKAAIIIKKGQFIVYTVYGKYQTQEELDFFISSCKEYGIEEIDDLI